jgi:hypothetical protein
MLNACRVIFLAILEIVMSSVNIVTLAPGPKNRYPKNRKVDNTRTYEERVVTWYLDDFVLPKLTLHTLDSLSWIGQPYFDANFTQNDRLLLAAQLKDDSERPRTGIGYWLAVKRRGNSGTRLGERANAVGRRVAERFKPHFRSRPCAGESAPVPSHSAK